MIFQTKFCAIKTSKIECLYTDEHKIIIQEIDLIQQYYVARSPPPPAGERFHPRAHAAWSSALALIVNGAKEGFGDSNNAKDWYLMGRFDYAKSDLFSASLSGFGYFGGNNAKVALPMGGPTPDVSWNRYGVSGRIRYKMVDIYGIFTIDHISDLPAGAFEQNFDATATGLTIQADVLATDRLLLSARFDNLDAGGVKINPVTKKTVRTSNTILAFQAKYYLRTNIALYIRNDVNLRDAKGGTSAPRNSRNAFLVGADLIY